MDGVLITESATAELRAALADVSAALAPLRVDTVSGAVAAALTGTPPPASVSAGCAALDRRTRDIAARADELAASLALAWRIYQEADGGAGADISALDIAGTIISGLDIAGVGR
ncbi:hypothetical protein [Actinotignum timonense]|uniref:hypothetical protein n=1 Tax=Actinotignum timonense TaxID=1870995 RepID=UPI000B35E70D|nr:hypothetical protein [Actinotignum timonense]